VMRALGMRTGQLRSAVRWQASAVGVAALVVGVPGGVIAGRLVWRQVAQSTGVAVTHEMAWRSLAVVTVVALVGALVLSWIPGRRATSASPASALTSE
jgi:ABC-type lipoprotein release transport system permease subunit